jgi:hypothetical protein
MSLPLPPPFGRLYQKSALNKIICFIREKTGLIPLTLAMRELQN